MLRRLFCKWRAADRFPPPPALHRCEVVLLALLIGCAMCPTNGQSAPPDAASPGEEASPFGPLARYEFKAAAAADEALIFTPPGFQHVGKPATVEGSESARLQIEVREAATGKPTFCRVNVVGADGNFYEPKEDHPLAMYSLTGQWPNWPRGWGNRPGKAPVRYFGRFFYCRGRAEVDVPPGPVRVEVWKGFEYRPLTWSGQAEAGTTGRVTLTLERPVNMPQHGYYGGDPHIHIPRKSEEDEQRILDLMEAEDIRYGTILAYNEPAGPYAGFMQRMDAPQLRGLGKRSILSRDGYHILSAQEYRSSTYGHLNLFLLDQLVQAGQSLNANNWPLYGDLAAAARQSGGFSFYAHGGYAQAIYADLVQGNVDGVELLQFGVYRGVGLIDWYHILNSGFRFPATGASDYPACRKLGDCRTYVSSPSPPDFADWLEGAAAGRSFVTTGPLLLLEVDGKLPGATITKEGDAAQHVTAHVRVMSQVAPVTEVQILVNGRVARRLQIPADQGKGSWLELKHAMQLDRSAWIAARAFSLSSLGTPDAEAHTNPVYVYLNQKAPYERGSVDALIARIDQQIAAHKKRTFPEQAKVLAYFERSRDILLKIRAAGGAAARQHPADVFREDAGLEDPGARTHSERQLKQFLKPLPPLPISEVAASFETAGGFRMELVAAEPLVRDPVAAAFDENGDLYVAEMSDYPYRPKTGKPPLGAVRLLQDRDGDGRFDKSHLFAEHLLWAAGVAPWKGGVFVASPPDIWYLKDTDGDHRADVRKKVFSGFGLDNQQAMLNNLQSGLDHKIYGSTAGNGGIVRRVDDPDSPAVSVQGRDFRFDPVSGRLETITGTVQFGNSFDDWGNRFLCSESQPLQHPVLPQRYLARNPFLPVPRAIDNLAPGPLPIYRISPIERWRQIRSSRRIAHGQRAATAAGASHHVIDAAAGVTIYRGGAYPAEYYGNVFIGGPQNNLIHRRVLKPAGVSFSSHRADEQTEMVRSSDNWFRPVNFVNAPDGTLYVLDMSREILETIHIPLDVVKHLDLRSGRSHGRIYRLAPPGFEYPGPPQQLADATTSELITALESPHGWCRDTAHRLIYERQDRAAVEPLRRQLVASQMPQARLLALWSLEGLQSLRDEDLSQALSDPFPAIREHAIRLAEGRLDKAPQLLEKVVQLARQPGARIRFQAALSLGESSDPRAVAALGDIARTSASDRWIRTAVLSSVAENADRLLLELLGDRQFASTPTGVGLLQELALVVGIRHQAEQVDQLLQSMTGTDSARLPPSVQQVVILALGRGLKRAGLRLPADRADEGPAARWLQQQLHDARQRAAAADVPPTQRQLAIELLGCMPLEQSRDVLTGLIDIQTPDPVQVAAIGALSDYADPEMGSVLLAGWRRYTPQVRMEVVRAMLAHQTRTLQLLRASQRGQATLAQIDATQRSLLLQHRNAEIRALANQLLGDQVLDARQAVVQRYQAALKLDSDRQRGEEVFRSQCTTCHRLGSQGHPVGPDLASSASHDAETLLVHILDPNRYVPPSYMRYLVVDQNGRTYTGIIAAETAGGITLKREKDETDTILRSNIESLVNMGQSMMPEGFEKNVNPQQMADLISFLQASRRPDDAASTPPPLDIGTLPGLVEPDN